VDPPRSASREARAGSRLVLQLQRTSRPIEAGGRGGRPYNRGCTPRTGTRTRTNPDDLDAGRRQRPTARLHPPRPGAHQDRPARPPRDRHHPHARDRRGPAGELGTSRCPDGCRADGVRPLDALPPPCPHPAGLAGARPVRPVRGPRQHAPLRPAPPDRLRRHAGRPPELPAVGLPNPGPSGVRSHRGRRGDHRPAGPGARQCGGDGHRPAPAGIRVPGSGCAGRPLDLRHLLGRRPPGGRRVGGVQPGRSPAPGPPGVPLRRQPDPARRADRVGLVRERHRPLRRLWLAHAAGGRRQRPGGHRARHRPCAL
jgi:hypothetical protein